MSSYPLSYTGPVIDDLLDMVYNPDTSPVSGSAKLITSGAVYAVLGDIETLLEAI